jgi:hypothetical protein
MYARAVASQQQQAATCPNCLRSFSQDTYTDDMTRYTAAMRENAVATNKLVSQQMSTLNKLETHVDANSEMQQLANNALDSLLKSSSGSMWYYWFLMMTATIMFAGMYIFMKIFPKV